MRVLIVGAVAAGMSAASKLRRNLKDCEIVVYEKSDEISYGACGIPFYVSNHIKKAEDLLARTIEDFKNQDIDVKTFHEVMSVNEKSKTVEIKNLKDNTVFTDKYDKLIIASGARVKVFAPFDRSYDNLCVVRNVADGTKIKQFLENGVKNVVVVGAGFIGLEMVEACAFYGAKVTLVELSDRILSTYEKEVTSLLTDELNRKDINVLTSSKLTTINGDDTIVSVDIDNNGSMLTIPCDLLINAVGITPNTGFINCVNKLNDAIIVDDLMRTNVEDIYAAGDCSIMKSSLTNEYLYAPLGTNANKQGRIIADVIANIEPKQLKLIGSSCIKLFDLSAAKVGIGEEEAIKLGLDYKTTLVHANSYASYYGQEKLDIKLIYDPNTKKLLGANTVGAGSVVERANYFAICLTAGLTVDEISFLDLCYSPPFSGVWDASLVAAGTAK